MVVSFSRKIPEILLFLINYRNLIDIIFYVIEFTILFLEILVALSLLLIIPPIREIFFGGIQNWNFKHILLKMNNYISRWINTFYTQKTVWHKISFVLFTIVTWLIFIILVIKNIMWIWNTIQNSIHSV